MCQLKKLLAKFSKISACVVEPSHELITKYQDMIKKDEAGMSDIKYKWQERIFKDYMEVENKGAGQMFDYISSFHSAYFLGDPGEAIKTLYSLLKPGGIMIILIVTGE